MKSSSLCEWDKPDHHNTALVELLAGNAQRLPDWLGHAPVFGTN
jgi:hypothetical protein